MRQGHSKGACIIININITINIHMNIHGINIEADAFPYVPNFLTLFFALNGGGRGVFLPRAYLAGGSQPVAAATAAAAAAAAPAPAPALAPAAAAMPPKQQQRVVTEWPPGARQAVLDELSPEARRGLQESLRDFRRVVRAACGRHPDGGLIEIWGGQTAAGDDTLSIHADLADPPQAH